MPLLVPDAIARPSSQRRCVTMRKYGAGHQHAPQCDRTIRCYDALVISRRCLRIVFSKLSAQEVAAIKMVRWQGASGLRRLVGVARVSPGPSWKGAAQFFVACSLACRSLLARGSAGAARPAPLAAAAAVLKALKRLTAAQREASAAASEECWSLSLASDSRPYHRRRRRRCSPQFSPSASGSRPLRPRVPLAALSPL